MDNILDHVVVQGQRYDIVSPTAFGDYIETIGSACINPDGYAQGSTFLAKFGNEQFYYEATAAITQGSAISEGTNCKRTTVTERESELASDIQTLSNQLDDEISSRVKLGAHNLLPNIARLETKNGVSFYPNTDGSISLSGTASGAAVFNSIEFKLTTPTGQYKFTGGIDDDVYFAILNITDGGTMAYDQGNGATLSLTKGKTYRFQFCVVSGKDTSGIVIYPMLRLASDTDTTYQPYAMTNRELTPQNGTMTSSYTIGSGSYLTKQGRIVTGFIKIDGLTTAGATEIVALPDGFIPVSGSQPVFLGADMVGKTAVICYITNGKIMTQDAVSNINFRLSFTFST